MKKLSFLFAALMLSLGAWAQTTVKGVVVDSSDQPVIGAGIVEAGKTGNGVVTGLDGEFTIKVPATAILQVSCIGYASKEVPVSGNTELRIVLQEDSELLDDVVVVAFGKMTREAFTGSAGTMKSDDLEKAQVTNAAQALAGRVAGVQINNTSGQLGSSPSITIRGIGSIYSDTQPLIVVNGMPFDGDLNLINSSDIESMTVLKDAASNALYGARGANGVIMITTKNGKAGDAKVTVDAKWGVNSNALQLYDTVDAAGFYENYYKTFYNQYILDGMSVADAHARANQYVQGPSTGPGYMVYTIPTGEDFILQGGKINPKASLGAFHNYDGQTFWLQPDDWQKEGLRNGFRQEYNVSVQGRVGDVNVFSSLSYLDQEGIQEGSDQDRITARLSADYQAKKWLKVGGNFNYTKYNYHNTGEGTLNAGFIWQTIKTQAPVYPVYLRDANGRIMTDKWGEQMFDFAQKYNLNRAGGTGGNTIFSNKYSSSGYDGNSFTASGYADIKLCKDLTFTVNASAYDYDRRYTSVTSPFVDYYTSSSDNGYLYKASMRTFTYNTQQLLNYSHLFGKHNVSAMLGHEYYNYKYEDMDVSGKNFGIDGATELGSVLNVNPNPSSSSEMYNVEGFFARAMYDYAGKYFASASYRRDASSRFSTKYRWGNFWSLGGAWVISKEDFFSVPWVNALKYKASIGSQGNDNIGEYLYANSYNIVNNNDKPAYQWRQKGTEDITWETNTNFNTGFEFDLFKGSRLTGSIDYFYRKTSDMLFQISTPPSIGYSSYWTNIGDMRNSGFELDLHATPIEKKDFRWNIDFNISHVKDKILNLPADLKTENVDGHPGFINDDSSFISKYRYYVGEGLPLYSWYLREYAGVDKTTGEALYYKDVYDDNGKFVETTTTTNSDEATYRLNGSAMPDFYGGLGMSFYFYGFDVSFNLTYQLGGLAYDYCYQIIMHNGSGNQIATTWHKDIEKAWTPSNTDTDVPRLNTTDIYTTSRSSRFLVNASYLNFQNVNVGYTIPSKLTSKAGLNSVRVYGAAENLFYISARKGFDPRYSLAGYNNMSSYNPIRTISGGITLTF